MDFKKSILKNNIKPYISQSYLNEKIELPRLWRSRGFLLHGLILSHESRITVLSPPVPEVHCFID